MTKIEHDFPCEKWDEISPLVISKVEAGNQGYIIITYLQENVFSCGT